MNIPATFEQLQKPGDKGYLAYLHQVLMRFWSQLAKVVNNGIEVYQWTDKTSGVRVAGNIKGFWWEGTVSNVVTINHDLGYAPTGFILIYNSSSSSVWTAGTPTKTQITIDATGSTNIKVLIV